VARWRVKGCIQTMALRRIKQAVPSESKLPQASYESAPNTPTGSSEVCACIVNPSPEPATATSRDPAPNHSSPCHGGLPSRTSAAGPLDEGTSSGCFLLIRIRCSLGGETTLRPVPAHVHAILKHGMTEAHAEHTETRSRYRIRKAIKFVGGDPGRW
jgi:hypothetical protein